VVITALGGGDIRKPPAITPRADKVFITQTPLFASILDGKKSSVLREGLWGEATVCTKECNERGQK
jgi:hypothetical protein